MNQLLGDWNKLSSPDSTARDLALSELRLTLVRSLTKALGQRAGVNEAFIEDMVQLSLLRILDKLDTFQGRSAFTTWAIAIALRIAMSELRRKHWNNVSLDELQQTNELIPQDKASQPSPDEASEIKETREILLETIHSQLNERQRLVLLADLNAMPHDEIAAQLQISRNAVYKLGHDARKALKRELEKAGYSASQLLAAFQPNSFTASV